MSLRKHLKYMKKHLKDYILFQISQGYESADIKDLLTKYGYSPDIVDDIFNEIGDIPQKDHKHATKKVSRDLFTYIQEQLMEYIQKEQDQGYSLDAIRRALLNYGHQPAIVEAAIISVKDGIQPDLNDFKHALVDERKHRGGNNFPIIYPGTVFTISMILVVALIFFITASSSSSLFIVGMAFAPTLMSLTAGYLAATQMKSKKFSRFMPLIVVGVTTFIFIFMVQLKSPLSQISDAHTVLLLNVLATFILSSFIALSVRAKIRAGDCKVDKSDIADIDDMPAIPPQEDEIDFKNMDLQKRLDVETDKLEKLIEKDFETLSEPPKKKKSKKIALRK